MSEEKKKTKKKVTENKEVTESQRQFFKTILALYITNNISKSQEELDEYIEGLRTDDPFYYTIDCIVNEVIEEPEWIKILEHEGMSPDDRSKEAWDEEFKKTLDLVDFNYCFEDGVDEIKALDVWREKEFQICLEEKKRKEEEERKKEEEKRKAEEAKKAEETAQDADAVEIKDSSAGV